MMEQRTISRTQLKRQNTTETVIVLAFFLFLLALGLLLYQDYGLTWDDLAQVEIGELNFNYAYQGDPALFSLKNRYYGPLFEMLLHWITRDLADPQRFFSRHLLTFFSFYLGMIFFYKLTKRITRNWLFGLLGCIILLLSPRIFAHSFYNSKDIPFMAMFIIAVYTLIKFLDKKNLLNALIHALGSAMLIALRAPGILIPALTLGFLLLEVLVRSKRTSIKMTILTGVLYAIITGGLTILFWPILWHDPLNEFINALQQMSKFPWLGGVVFYRAQFVDAQQLPWHYIPLWILITTPLAYLALAGLGAIKESISFFASKGLIVTARKRNFLILTAWSVLPILAVISLKSVLYDAWRQMFFIYPAIVLFAMLGLQAIYNLRTAQLPRQVFIAISILIFLGIILAPLNFMLNNHPHQNVYFNRLGGEDMARVKRHYELDYWGLSYKQGLEYILANDPSDTIMINVANAPGKINSHILPFEQAARLQYVETPEEADYFLTNYRYHPESYEYENEVQSIMVGNVSILSIFKIQP